MNVRPIDKEQIKAIHALLSARGLHEQKRSMISDVSYGRTESTTQLTYQEAQELIGYLNGGKNSGASSQNTEEEMKVIRMRKKFFAMCFEIGWIGKKMEVKNGKLQEVNDYSTVENWLDKFGYLHKKLNDYQYKELPKLLSQFEFGPYKEYMNKL